MDERRDQPLEPEAGVPLPIAASTRLSPVQEAWGAYTGHATHCDTCRSRDGGRCERAESLYRAYEQLSSAATRQLNRGTI